MEGKSRYNPQIHHRRSIRLKGYDYSSCGLYFITICCHGMLLRFGKVLDGEMILNDFGQIAQLEWEKLPERSENLELETYQIMPNHMHGILYLKEGGGIQNQKVNDELYSVDEGISTVGVIDEMDLKDLPELSMKKKVIGQIVGAYKSLVVNSCLKSFKEKQEKSVYNHHMGKIWQRNFYEHIIRSEESFIQISNYIASNPLNWANDKFYRE